MQMNKTILVFEDDPQVRQLLCSFLRRLGYEARTASDGATVLGLVRTAAQENQTKSDGTLPRTSLSASCSV